MYITFGIASSTHIDLHNERMAKVALDRMVEQIKEKYIAFLVEHDVAKQGGVILYGEVFQLKDGEYALGVVVGVPIDDEEKKKFVAGLPNATWKDFKRHLIVEDLISMSEQRQKEIKNSESSSAVREHLNLADLLERHLDSTQVWYDGRVYKVKFFIASIGDLVIEVLPGDHEPTHFHVQSTQRKINARFNIKNIELMKTKGGYITEKDVKKIQDFFRNYPENMERLRKESKRLSK